MSKKPLWAKPSEERLKIRMRPYNSNNNRNNEMETLNEMMR